ncbi:CLUMA_CG019785, isoform A [Clunio marinus]|uniref:CLUMA_CG019785, isoform A n=1 Tax=Clunio marinus TaxID=568069 RepID=A0A1J1J2T4_9DIPT|nr:CLUMA_CG019785, isoform A [Clunio marinus]
MDKIIKNENIDHIYCNKITTREGLPYSDKSNFIGDDKTVKKMKNFILSNINLIEELQSQLQERDSLIAKLLAENESLKQRLQRYKHSKGSSKKSDFYKDSNNTTNNNNNNNNLPVATHKHKPNEKKNDGLVKDKRVSIDTSEDEIFKKKPLDDSQESISIKLSSKNLFLMTNKPYIINDWKVCDLEDEEIQKGFDDINLEVPRWVEVNLPTTPTNEIENLPVEDVSDEAFLKRHLKYEIDERRRKKWDQQRIREQKNIERLKKRHLKEEYAEMINTTAKIPKTMISFFPDIETIKFIQISDDLPISAFGEQIPKLQPKDFSLPWLSDNDNDNSNIYSIETMCSNGNPRMKVRTKFISRCSKPIAK